MKFIGKAICNMLLWLCENTLILLAFVFSFIMFFIIRLTQSNLATWILKSATLHTIFIIYVLDVFNEALNKNTDINQSWHDFKDRTTVVSNLSLDEIKENISDHRLYTM